VRSVVIALSAVTSVRSLCQRASVWSTKPDAWGVGSAQLPALLMLCRSCVALRARHHRVLPTLMSGRPSTPRCEAYHSQGPSSGGPGSTTSVWRVHSLMGPYHSLLAPPNQSVA
jgi:hypothetical protein